MDDPVSLSNHLRDLYLMYLDSAMPLRGEELMRERRRLLAQRGVLWQEPRIELVPPYGTTRPLADCCRSLGLSPDLASFAACGLFPKTRKLYVHQRNALEAVSVQNKHLVVTTGTGSGKTECFLLPTFEQLLRESREHAGPRSPAVRALVLYPLNALVEDQLVRLRMAADSVSDRETGATGAREWLDTHRGGLRFHFGRYTGRTPVSGRRTKPKMRQWNRERARLARQARSVAERLDLRYQFPSLDKDAAEQWDRWSMQSSPPDILVTNYSMLNIMLMRDIERDIFEKTRQWLKEDDGHIFHLVIDELHSYRGTQGTEVAYLVRLLLDRLDLTPDSPQVRFLASTASPGESDKRDRYLSAFFGVKDIAQKFAIFGGSPVAPTPRDRNSLVGRAAAFARFRECWDNSESSQAKAVEGLAEDLGTDAPAPTHAPCDLALALERADVLAAVQEDYQRPETPDELGRRVFGEGASGDAVAGLLQALSLARLDSGPNAAAPLPVRMHMFFRNALGLWACCDPHCSQLPAARDADGKGRTLGKLYASPRLTCECGARVLDVLVCQSCGEVYLGGFRRSDGDSQYLVHDQPRLEDVLRPRQMPARMENTPSSGPRRRITPLR